MILLISAIAYIFVFSGYSFGMTSEFFSGFLFTPELTSSKVYLTMLLIFSLSPSSRMPWVLVKEFCRLKSSSFAEVFFLINDCFLSFPLTGDCGFYFSFFSYYAFSGFSAAFSFVDFFDLTFEFFFAVLFF